MGNIANVLLLYDEFNPSVRLCAYEQLTYLAEKKMIRLSTFPIYKVNRKSCQDNDIIFIVRASTSFEQLLIRKLKKIKKKIIYVLDDDLFHIPKTSISYQYYSNYFVKKRMIEIMKNSDLLISPSPKLNLEYGRFFNKTLVIEEPCLIPLVHEKKNVPQDNNHKIKIGFAGSVDRSIEFGVLFEEILLILLKKYSKNIELEFIGAKPDFSKNIVYRYVPYMDSYEDYQSYMRKSSWDIGLAPLTNDKFHQCKHYNKFLEYSSFSIVGIYSNVYPYTRVIQHKRNGLLCENTCESWVNAISWLIDNEKERQQIQQVIEEDRTQLYSLDSVSKIFLEKIIVPCQNDYNSKKMTGLAFVRIYSFLERTVSFIMRNGYKTPYLILIKTVNFLFNKKLCKHEKKDWYRKK